MADKKISELAAVTLPAGAQQAAVNDAGTTRRVTLDQIVAYLAICSAGQVVVPVGTGIAPGLAFLGALGTGFYPRDGGRITVTLAGTPRYEFQGSHFALNADTGLGWTSTAVD